MTKNKSITKYIKMDIKVSNLSYWSNKDVHLKSNSSYTLIIDYPFEKPGTFKVKTGARGMGTAGLLHIIGKSYIKQYANAEKDDEQGYWHGIGDLVIEGIKVNHKKKLITLDVGS
jgi:hypothetical protein